MRLLSILPRLARKGYTMLPNTETETNNSDVHTKTPNDESHSQPADWRSWKDPASYLSRQT
ncbi:MAG: hypothetical protein Q9183_008047, partial [Haloplaca sp. 2 TL-2023]